MTNQRINDEERRQWVSNDEGLYNWQRSSSLSMQGFIRAYRLEIDEVIRKVRDGVEPSHYLAYDHGPGCKCARCRKGRF